MAYNENPSYLEGPITLNSTLTGGAANSVIPVGPGLAGEVLTAQGLSLPPSYQPISFTSVTRPAFFAYLNTTASNATGDGTVYNIVYDAEVYDQANNFNITTGIFTAPFDGIYMFSGSAFLLGLSPAFTVGILQLNITGNISTAKSYIIDYINPGAVETSSNFYQADGSTILAKMTALDEAFISIQVGGSTSTVSINSSGSPFQSFFQGVLIT